MPRSPASMYTAYQTEEFADLYDVVASSRDDEALWRRVAAGSVDGTLLELGCGTGRVLLALARAGYRVTGLDRSASMVAYARRRLQDEERDVRERVDLIVGDMTSFELGRRFGAIIAPFGGFQHLSSVDQQIACLERCSAHLLPGGRLVLDLFNADPVPVSLEDAGTTAGGGPTRAEDAAEVVEWTAGRRVRFWMTVVGYRRSSQCMDCEVTYEVVAPDGATRRLTDTLPLRYIFRFELEHLLARCGFRLAELYGDYDGAPFADDSLVMIATATPVDDPPVSGS